MTDKKAEDCSAFGGQDPDECKYCAHENLGGVSPSSVSTPPPKEPVAQADRSNDYGEYTAQVLNAGC